MLKITSTGYVGYDDFYSSYKQIFFQRNTELNFYWAWSTWHLLKSTFVENNIEKIKEIEKDVCTKIKLIEETSEKSLCDFSEKRDNFAENLISGSMKPAIFKYYSESQMKDKMVTAGR